MLNEHRKKIIFIAIGIALLILLYALKNTGYFFRLSTFVFSLFLFYIIDLWIGLGFKKYHYVIFSLISISGTIFSPLYFISPNYDKLLHLFAPILLCILVYYLLDKVKIKFSTKLLLTFAVMVTTLAVFEIGEYALDMLFDLKLQGVYIRDISGVAKLNIIMDKNDDTMIDMMLGMVGAMIYILIKAVIFYERRFIKKIKNKYYINDKNTDNTDGQIKNL